MLYFEGKNCTKFDFDLGSARTPLGELTALARLSSCVWGEGEGRVMRERKGREGETIGI